jgi:sialate O-acetylesterase
MKKIHLSIFMLVLALTTPLTAAITLPSIFADNMVIQRETNTKLWGQADPEKRVTVVTSWNLRRYSTTSDSEGRWEVIINTPKAGGPHTIVISDGRPMTLSNVMSGDVWLCSGQSNMEMKMEGGRREPVEGSTMDILRSPNSKIRLFTVAKNHSLKPQTNVVGHWQEAMPLSVGSFSATAYYFGRLLNEILDIPVGLISSSWGGSRIEAWMNKEMLSAFPHIAIPEPEESVQHPNQKPLYLYQAMIHPLEGFAVKGTIWYQGESNLNNAHEYAELFGAMVEGWRKRWNQPEMPFYFCQIAPFEYRNNINSAYLREAQLQASLKVPHTGMAVLMDAGEQYNIHPAKKKEAGERLALLAIQKTYTIEGINGESPVYKSIEIKDSTITVHFDKAPLGVSGKDYASQLFSIAGEDRVFHPAKAQITREGIIVSSEKVQEPVAVRYAFENYVKGDLFGVNGLPVSSFRSDNW